MRRSGRGDPVFSGPVYKSMKVDGDRAVRFPARKRRAFAFPFFTLARPEKVYNGTEP